MIDDEKKLGYKVVQIALKSELNEEEKEELKDRLAFKAVISIQ